MKRFVFILLFFLAFLVFSPTNTYACNPPYDNTGCPPETNPDFNFFGVYQGLIVPINAPPEDYNLQHFQHPVDSAPQLTGLIQGNTHPTITNIYQITGVNPPGYADLPGNYSPAVGFGTSPGQSIQVPQSPYDLGGGYEVQVLYADTTSITINYSLAGTPAVGYTIHIGSIQTNPAILALYQQSLTGANSLPTLSAFQELGISLGSEIIVALRDTGTLMDPRWIEDWWMFIYDPLNPLQPILSEIVGAFPPGYQPTLSCPSEDQGTLRPKAYSASCKVQKVPDKVKAKVEKFWVKTKITMKIDDAMTNLCNGTYYPLVTWNAQVGVDLSKTYYPQAGFGKSYTTPNPEAEYLADYITGSLYGDGKVPTTLTEAWNNAGIFRKISTGWYEDEKKCKLIKKAIENYDIALDLPNTAIGQIAQWIYSLTPLEAIGNLTGLQTGLNHQNLKSFTCPPSGVNTSWIDYLNWKVLHPRDAYLWAAVPNFTPQDTPGDILITATSPPSQITTGDKGSKQEASNKIRSALSVPHSQRTVDSAREMVQMLAPAGLENLDTKPKNPFANSKKDYSSEVASMDSSDGEIFRIITTKLSSLYIQAKNKIIAFAQSKNLLAQIPTTPGNACLGPNGQDGGMNMIINEENGGIQIHAWNTQPPECGDPSDYEFHVRYLWDGAEIGGCDEYKGGGGYLPRYNPNGTPEERYGLWINGMSNGNCAVPESEIKNRNGGSISGWKDHLTVQYWISNSHGIDNIPGCSKTRACNCPAGDPNCFAPPKPPTPPPPPPCGLSFNKSQVTIKGDIDEKEPNKLNNVRKDPIIIEVNNPDSPPISGLSENEAIKIRDKCNACKASGQGGCKCSVTLDYGTIIELEANFPYNKTIWEKFAKERESGFLNYFIPAGTGEGFKSDDNSSKIGYTLYSLTAAKPTKDSTLEIIGGDSGTDIEGKIESGLYLFGAQKAKQCVSQKLFLPSFAGQPVECPNLL